MVNAFPVRGVRISGTSLTDKNAEVFKQFKQVRIMLLHSLVLSSLLGIARAADYSGRLRPQVHFSPPSGFMNDPNGLFFDSTRGVYHLYYQCELCPA